MKTVQGSSHCQKCQSRKERSQSFFPSDLLPGRSQLERSPQDRIHRWSVVVSEKAENGTWGLMEVVIGVPRIVK
jgi:hypothetical protein